ncbi:hypothetical protein [Salegentibacter mishustinae]|uniref:HTH cro/C1-type domain-containing protein n=1 Tax=Salegentibacter mishustinae TaxID=270918 RepID=A0A0Q9ZC43_9FLAO|nr:hypothetical protein [Salegentibacter mishustinae]KRG30576.1 hypothetical protein APR42_01540 [Salegentibacter mishustinae]PNW23465.1 hypothetical protein APB85_01535 [Salegentibacter mishustinae]PZX66539.1 hypothetical protein LY54_00937 [Salegentibacter mishustinae]GGW83106.1 hypothetical protein GCM10008086_08990 [Salegentibacter mishustinae]
MAKDDQHKDPTLLSIGSMFETGRIKKMYTLSELYPTKIAKSLGINYGRYMVKLSHPDRFTLGEIVRLANLLNIEPEMITKVIYSEMEK